MKLYLEEAHMVQSRDVNRDSVFNLFCIVNLFSSNEK